MQKSNDIYREGGLSTSPLQISALASWALGFCFIAVAFPLPPKMKTKIKNKFKNRNRLGRCQSKCETGNLFEVNFKCKVRHSGEVMVRAKSERMTTYSGYSWPPQHLLYHSPSKKERRYDAYKWGSRISEGRNELTH